MDSKKYNNLLKLLVRLTRIETGSHMNIEGDFVDGYYVNFPFSNNHYGHFVANHTIPDTIDGKNQIFSSIPSWAFDAYLSEYNVEQGRARLWDEYTDIIVNKLINLKSKKNRLNEHNSSYIYRRLSIADKVLDNLENDICDYVLAGIEYGETITETRELFVKEKMMDMILKIIDSLGSTNEKITRKKGDPRKIFTEINQTLIEFSYPNKINRFFKENYRSCL